MRSDLHWKVVSGGNVPKGSIVDASIPYDRIDELLKGEEKQGACGFYIRRTKSSIPGSLDIPKETSILVSKELHCQFGPEDPREGSEAHRAFVVEHEDNH